MKSPVPCLMAGVLALVLAVSLCGCRSETGHTAGVGAVVGEATESLESAEAAAMIIVDLPDTVISKVKGPGGYFMVTARKGEMERFRCSGCHNDHVSITGG